MYLKNTHTLRTAVSRRSALKFGLAALIAGIAGLASHMSLRPGVAHAAELLVDPSLIVYYSRTGNTRTVAQQIQNRVGGELFEVRTTHTYPETHRATTEQARRELDSNFRPTLAAQVANMDAYKMVFIGYPNWWGTMPTALFSFLESYNFSGKTLVPFCTHEGSGLSRGPADIAKLCPGATVLTGFAMRGGRVASAQGDVDKWLKKINLA